MRFWKLGHFRSYSKTTKNNWSKECSGEMCFALQWRPLFWHLNSQKSDLRLRCFVRFYFEVRFMPQRRAVFHLSSPQMAPAALASLLFDRPEPEIIQKMQCFATFLPFRAPWSFLFWLFLFSDFLSSLLFSSLTLPTSAFHLWTKLPSVNTYLKNS